MTVCLENTAQAAEVAGATASKSLLESLDDSDDDFGGPPSLLSAASVVSLPLQPEAGQDAGAWRAQLMAAEAPCTAAREHYLAEPDAEAESRCSIASAQLYRQLRDTGQDPSILDSQTPVADVLRTTHVVPDSPSPLLQAAA